MVGGTQHNRKEARTARTRARRNRGQKRQGRKKQWRKRERAKETGRQKKQKPKETGAPHQRRDSRGAKDLERLRWYCDGTAMVVQWWCGGSAVVVRWYCRLSRVREPETQPETQHSRKSSEVLDSQAQEADGGT